MILSFRLNLFDLQKLTPDTIFREILHQILKFVKHQSISIFTHFYILLSLPILYAFSNDWFQTYGIFLV